MNSQSATSTNPAHVAGGPTLAAKVTSIREFLAFKLGAAASHLGVVHAVAVRSLQTAGGGNMNTERRVLAPPSKPALRSAARKIVAKAATPARGDANWATS